MGILIQETYVDDARHCIVGETDVFESCFDTPGEVYRGCLKLYGRCISKQYVDVGGKSKHIGWVFQKRVKYEDCKDTYLQDTWVSLHTNQPTRTVTPHYLELAS